MWDFPFYPEAASTIAPRIDAIYWTLVALSAVFSLGVAVLIVFFAIRYREGMDVNRTKLLTENMPLELSWVFIPLGLALGVFAWSAVVYADMMRTPADTLNIYVIGKQWMWQVQHPSGALEINNLHVPVNQPVQLIMTSQDVIHDFYIPAFRLKYDVLPGRYTTLWFEATQTGQFHLFCAEYCGTDHSRMVGSVIVMEQVDYETWLSGDSGLSMEAAGQQIFERRGCSSCHSGEPDARGPALAGLFGQTVALEDGQTVVADEAYILESIVEPNAKIVQGYPAIMPTYEGMISDEGLFQLVAYIKSLSDEANQQSSN
jgi:cytochrome c oxidase subunit 2